MPRARDDVLLTRLSGGRATVVGRWSLPWSAWGIEAPANEGIEGLCTSGVFVVAGGEPVIRGHGARWAPVARMERRGLTAGPWTPFRLRFSPSCYTWLKTERFIPSARISPSPSKHA